MSVEEEGPLSFWTAPQPHEVGESVEEFLDLLGSPTVITLPGQDPTRTRAFVTLLHGNEPSGVLAFHRLIKNSIQPAVNIIGIVVSVKSALLEPGFFYRNLPGYKDINRCFRAPFDGEEGELAQAIVKALVDAKPESLLDLHNTSGAGPAFSVSVENTVAHHALTSLFTQQMIYTSIRLGALMELDDVDFPVITIEAGGAQDRASHEIAYNGLLKYMTLDDVLSRSLLEEQPMTVLSHPVRIELSKEAKLAYGRAADAEADLTLLPDVERHNFGVISDSDSLGWLGPKGLSVLSAIDADGNEQINALFQITNDELRPKKKLRLFMVTPRSTIARSDCLFYAIEA